MEHGAEEAAAQPVAQAAAAAQPRVDAREAPGPNPWNLSRLRARPPPPEPAVNLVSDGESCSPKRRKVARQEPAADVSARASAPASGPEGAASPEGDAGDTDAVGDDVRAWQKLRPSFEEALAREAGRFPPEQCALSDEALASGRAKLLATGTEDLPDALRPLLATLAE